MRKPSTALLLSLSSITFADTLPEPTVCQFSTESNTWQCPPSRDASEKTQTQLELDWIDKQYLHESLREALNPGCTGTYVDPLSGQHVDDTAINTTPLLVEADYAEVFEANTASLKGDVRVSQGPRSISAESMTYDRASDSASLEESVTIRQPDMLILGGSASVSTIDHKGEFKNARFVMHRMHMRGSASSIEQDGPNKVVLKDGSISSCEPNSNAWSLEGKELSVDRENGQGYGKNVRFKVGGVPVFYLPYISFPVGDERRSGFLFPSFGNTDDGGLDISVPYYLNLAPNYDATLTPRIITGRGQMLEAEARHLNRLFYTEISGGYLGNDSGGNLQHELDSEPSRYRGNNRWLFQLNQIGGRRSGWYSNIDYTKTSDTDYFRDLGTSSFSVSNTTYLNQSIDGGISTPNWHLYARIQDYQTLLLNIDRPYRKVPELSADGIFNVQGLKLTLDNQITRFNHRDTTRLDGSPIITGDRFFTDYRIGKRFESTGAFIHPEIGHKALSYRFKLNEGDTLNNDSTNLTAGQFSLDLGAVFEHTEGRFTQTLEPRAKYLFRDYEDHSELYDATLSGQRINFDTTARNFSYGQLYRDSRFSGSDRLDDANQVTVGLTNRWYTQSGHELFNVSVGQINHFRDRRIELEGEISSSENTSEWALEFGTFWQDGSSLFGNLIYDDGAEQITRLSAGYNYASDDQLSLYSLSYSYVRESSEIEEQDQIDGTFVAPVTQHWYVMGRANYDIENSQELETFLGFEYNNCCYRFRILAKRWLDSNIANLDSNNDAVFDQGIFYEFHFRGLGSAGARITSMLEDAIPGYHRRETVLNKHK